MRQNDHTLDASSISCPQSFSASKSKNNTYGQSVMRDFTAGGDETHKKTPERRQKSLESAKQLYKKSRKVIHSACMIFLEEDCEKKSEQ
jgi:hypothetical protein